jgi:hypothetical protein
MTDSNHDVAALLHEAQIAGLGRPLTHIINRLHAALSTVMAERDAAVAAGGELLNGLGKDEPDWSVVDKWEAVVAALHAPEPAPAARIRLLEKALAVTMRMLSPQQPGDSRAVDDWFVACAAIQCELTDTDGKIEKCLDDALSGPEPEKGGISDAVVITFDIDPPHAAGDVVSRAAVLAILAKEAAACASLPAEFSQADVSLETVGRWIKGYAALVAALPAPAGEPVAWQQQTMDGTWATMVDGWSPADSERWKDFQFRPLYAHPDHAQEDRT